MGKSLHHIREEVNKKRHNVVDPSAAWSFGEMRDGQPVRERKSSTSRLNTSGRSKLIEWPVSATCSTFAFGNDTPGT
jgi:hypothetical protein